MGTGIFPKFSRDLDKQRTLDRVFQDHGSVLLTVFFRIWMGFLVLDFIGFKALDFKWADNPRK
jgi:hypothetical protein